MTFPNVAMKDSASTKQIVRDTVLNSFAASTLLPNFLRCVLYRVAGLDVQTSGIYPRCFMGHQISIGPGTFVNYDCFFDTSAPIRIGKNCSIAMGVYMVTSDHATGPRTARAGALQARPISVGDGSWIGARALLLPGVSIGEGCVVGAGSVVTHDCEPHSLYVGVPATHQAIRLTLTTCVVP